MRKNPKVAIIHDWLTVYAGAERALEQLLMVFPEADLFSICDFVPDDQRRFLKGKTPITSFIQNLPYAKKYYRHYLPIMPFAVEQFDLSGYDLIISSSHAVAKGVLTGPDQVHVSYIYSPMRYAWDLQHQYLRESAMTTGFKSTLARILLHYLRIWDYRTAAGVNHFVAISNFIGRRVKKVYGRESDVIYPPVDTSHFDLGTTKSDFYLTASRMVPYKRIDLIVEAFAQMPDKKLVVIGDGPEMEKIRKLVKPNIQLLGFQDSKVLKDHMQKAKAFLFAAEEDFGIAPLEAQACGTPVIAFGKGGALETIVGLESGQGPTGVFFEEQTAASIIAAVQKFESVSTSISPLDCRSNALRFSPEKFRDAWKTFLAKLS